MLPLKCICSTTVDTVVYGMSTTSRKEYTVVSVSADSKEVVFPAPDGGIVHALEYGTGERGRRAGSRCSFQ